MIKILLASALLVASPLMENTTTNEETTTETTTTTEETTTTETETKTDEDKKVEEQVNQVWEDFKVWASKWLEPTTIATISSWITYLGTIIALIMKLRNAKINNSLTVEKVRDELNATLGDKVDVALKKELESYIPGLIDVINNQQKILEVFSKIMALSQENTPESRVAILNLIASLGVVDTTEQKKAIEEQVKVEQEKQEEKDSTLESIINEK